MAEDFSFEIVKEYGVLSENKTGWRLELNTVNWNKRGEKFRSWSSDHQKMGKGVTLTKDEMVKLKELIEKIEL